MANKQKIPPYDGEEDYPNYLHICMANRDHLTPKQWETFKVAVANVYHAIKHDTDPCAKPSATIISHPWVQIPP